jgi:hypothetical protein
MSRNAFPKIEREQAQAMALREHAAMERKQADDVLAPFCRICGWRKWGKDSWDGKSCKCRMAA